MWVNREHARQAGPRRAAGKRRAGEFTRANRSVGEPRAGVADAQAARAGPGKFRAGIHASPARDALRDSVASRSLVRHVRLIRDFFSLGASGPGVALLFCRVSRAVSALFAARGKCVVAILKERNVHGHVGKSGPSTHPSADGAARRPEPISHRANPV
jgi:hypothetical protein